MATQPLKTFSSSSPESNDIWDEIFKTERSTQADYEEFGAADDDVDEIIEDRYGDED